MSFWNGKEKPIMASASAKPDPDKSALRHVQPKSDAGQPNPLPAEKDDPIDSAMHLWVLRLWVLCALVIVSYAICNYLAHWLAK